MRFDVITLFPDLFGPHLSQGITRRAFESRRVDVRLWQLRDFAEDNYRRVDDRPYGGGPGMVMLVEPLLRALQAVLQERAAAAQVSLAGPTGSGPTAPTPPTQAARASSASSLGPVAVVHFTPTGRRLDQTMVQEFASGSGAVLVCGRYEGIDQRFIDQHVTHEISLGDLVLSGGELPALALLDAVARLQEGVLQPDSHQQDSFSDGLLEGPSWSRPETLLLDGHELSVPPVLLSGHHGEVQRFKREQALAVTARRRPDLIDRARSAGRLSRPDEQYLRTLGL